MKTTSLPTIFALNAKMKEAVDILAENAQELYTHVNELLIHCTRRDDGSLVLTPQDIEELQDTMRRFSLR